MTHSAEVTFDADSTAALRETETNDSIATANTVARGVQ
jgi:hypothetical protein